MRPVYLLLLIASSADARGTYYAEAGAGGIGFIGDTGGDVAPGPVLGIRGGWTPIKWFSLGLSLSGSNHEATLPPPPAGQYFQIYEAAVEIRLSLRIRRTALFVEDTTGFAAISTNVLDDVGVTDPDRHMSPFISPGVGIDYHLQDQHFSLGIAGDWTYFPLFGSSMAVGGRIYLRYTK